MDNKEMFDSLMKEMRDMRNDQVSFKEEMKEMRNEQASFKKETIERLEFLEQGQEKQFDLLATVMKE
ncbi:hypothetical protein [Virgibacillus sp. CBA3643]|uniref:hypothetical protein n=1 Tax=Virgibacillus sp. CBA3643 TaxID=2942278 RepID=UPI0035A356AF